MGFRLMGMAAACSLILVTAFDSNPSHSQELISEIQFRPNDLPVIVGGRGLNMRLNAPKTDTEIDVLFDAPDGFVICDVRFDLSSAIMPGEVTEPFWGGTLQTQTTLRSYQVNGTGPGRAVHAKPSGRVTVQLIPDTASRERCRRPVTDVWYCKGAGNTCQLR